MKRMTAEEAIKSQFDLDALSRYIDGVTEEYKKELKKGLTDLALKQIDERTIQPSNAIVDALLKLADQD